MPIPTYAYPLNTDGSDPQCFIPDERHQVTPVNGDNYNILVPRAAPFFRNDDGDYAFKLYKVEADESRTELFYGVDYYFAFKFDAATIATSLGVYGGIVFYDRDTAGTYSIDYSTVGSRYVLDYNTVLEYLLNFAADPRTTTWEALTDVPSTFPVVDHMENIQNMKGFDDVIAVLESFVTQMNDTRDRVYQTLQTHLLDTDNPHQTTLVDQSGNPISISPSNPTDAAEGTSNVGYMTPALTTAHWNNIGKTYVDNLFSNLEASDVGLENVANLLRANQAQAEAHTTNEAYLTPLSGYWMAAVSFAPISHSHTVDQVTGAVPETRTVNGRPLSSNVTLSKSDIGLNLVENAGFADSTQLDAGASGVYVDPAGVESIAQRIAGSVSGGVTKESIGLGEVVNAGFATDAQAIDGNQQEVYMDPRAVALMINALVPQMISAAQLHFSESSNLTLSGNGTEEQPYNYNLKSSVSTSNYTATNDVIFPDPQEP